MTERLLSDGHQVVVVDDLSTGFKEYVPSHRNLKFLQLDISDLNSLVRNIGHFMNADGVFHFAACARIQPSIYEPLKTHDVNVTGTINILELMKFANIKNIVYSASSSYYGQKARIPSLETDSSDCQTPYSASKYMGEIYCSTWSKVYENINSIRLRYFNVWGPRSPTEGQYAPVLSLFYRQALDNKPITVVGDGEQRRDFTHVLDVVEANVRAMDYMSRNKNVDETFNIGTGKNYSIKDIAIMVQSNVLRYKPRLACQIVYVPERIGEAKLSLANNEKAKSLLGWTPKHSIESKLEELLLFYLSQEEKEV